MTQSRPDLLQDLDARPDVAGDRPPHSAPDMDPPPPVKALLPLVRRLLGSGSDADAMPHAQRLAARIEARVAQCRASLIRTGLDAAAPAMAARLEADTADLGRLLVELAERLDAASALVLLDEAGLRPDLGGLLDGVPELREAALDALTPRQADRFDALCRSACTVQVRSAISRLPLGAMDRAALRQRIPEQRPGGASPDGGEPAFLDALRRGDHAAALALLSAAALVPRELVAATVALRNQRGLVSLAWKAGYSMRAAVLLQSQVTGIAPDALLHATADGGCPLGRSEMVWQVGLLSRMSP